MAAPSGDTDAGPASAPSPRHLRSQDDALDLGATVLPVLVRSYRKQGAVALLLVAVVAWLLSRR